MATRFSVYHNILLCLVMLCGTACTPANLTDQPVSTATQSAGLSSPQISQKCLAVYPNRPEDLKLSGKLITTSNHNVSMLSLPGLEEEDLPKSYWPFLMSPDQKRFAFIEMTDSLVYSRLIVMDSQGRLITSFNWEPELEYPIQWVDNNKLLIRTSDVNSLMLLDITSGEKQNIPFPYGNELYVEDGVAKIRSGFLAYNPYMTNVMYEGIGHVFILRDLEILPNAILWAKRNNSNWADPIWSPDHKRIAVPLMNGRGIDDLYTVDAFGDSENRLTDFDTMYDHPTAATIYDFSWSPDSVYLAIQLDLRTNEQDPPEKIDTRLAGRLLVINSITQEIVDYCLIHTYTPVWSPDGKYLAIDGIIVDLSKDTAYKVTDENIIGWLPGN